MNVEGWSRYWTDYVYLLLALVIVDLVAVIVLAYVLAVYWPAILARRFQRSDKEHEQKSIPPPPPVPLIDPKSSSVVVWHEKEDLHNRVIDSKTSVSDYKTRDCHKAEENPPPLPTSPPPPWRSRYPPVIVQDEEQPANIIYVPEPGVASQTRVSRPSSLSPAFEQEHTANDSSENYRRVSFQSPATIPTFHATSPPEDQYFTSPTTQTTLTAELHSKIEDMPDQKKSDSSHRRHSAPPVIRSTVASRKRDEAVKQNNNIKRAATVTGSGKFSKFNVIPVQEDSTSTDPMSSITRPVYVRKRTPTKSSPTTHTSTKELALKNSEPSLNGVPRNNLLIPSPRSPSKCFSPNCNEDPCKETTTKCNVTDKTFFPGKTMTSPGELKHSREDSTPRKLLYDDSVVETSTGISPGSLSTTPLFRRSYETAKDRAETSDEENETMNEVTWSVEADLSSTPMSPTKSTQTMPLPDSASKKSTTSDAMQNMNTNATSSPDRTADIPFLRTVYDKLSKVRTPTKSKLEDEEPLVPLSSLLTPIMSELSSMESINLTASDDGLMLDRETSGGYNSALVRDSQRLRDADYLDDTIIDADVTPRKKY